MLASHRRSRSQIEMGATRLEVLSWGDQAGFVRRSQNCPAHLRQWRWRTPMTRTHRRLRRIDRLLTEHDEIPDVAAAVAIFEGRGSADDCSQATRDCAAMLTAMDASVPTSPEPDADLP